MPTAILTSALPLRSPSAANGSVYIAFTGPALPARKTQSQRKTSMPKFLSQRLDRALTTVAMFGLLSPLVLASLMVVVTPH